jgi:hypothetical protein
MPRPHIDYAKYMDKIEPIFKFLETPGRLPYGAIDTIATETGIEAGTLRDWRQKLKSPVPPGQPAWRPYQNRNQHRRALTDEQEGPWLSRINNADGQTGMWLCNISSGSPGRTMANQFF